MAEIRLRWLEVQPAEIRLHWLEFDPNTETQWLGGARDKRKRYDFLNTPDRTAETQAQREELGIVTKPKKAAKATTVAPVAPVVEKAQIDVARAPELPQNEATTGMSADQWSRAVDNLVAQAVERTKAEMLGQGEAQKAAEQQAIQAQQQAQAQADELVNLQRMAEDLALQQSEEQAAIFIAGLRRQALAVLLEAQKELLQIL